MWRKIILHTIFKFLISSFFKSYIILWTSKKLSFQNIEILFKIKYLQPPSIYIIRIQSGLFIVFLLSINKIWTKWIMFYFFSLWLQFIRNLYDSLIKNKGKFDLYSKLRQISVLKQCVAWTFGVVCPPQPFCSRYLSMWIISEANEAQN